MRSCARVVTVGKSIREEERRTLEESMDGSMWEAERAAEMRAFALVCHSTFFACG